MTWSISFLRDVPLNTFIDQMRSLASSPVHDDLLRAVSENDAFRLRRILEEEHAHHDLLGETWGVGVFTILIRQGTPAMWDVLRPWGYDRLSHIYYSDALSRKKEQHPWAGWSLLGVATAIASPDQWTVLREAWSISDKDVVMINDIHTSSVYLNTLAIGFVYGHDGVRDEMMSRWHQHDYRSHHKSLLSDVVLIRALSEIRSSFWGVDPVVMEKLITEAATQEWLRVCHCHGIDPSEATWRDVIDTLPSTMEADVLAVYLDRIVQKVSFDPSVPSLDILMKKTDRSRREGIVAIAPVADVSNVKNAFSSMMDQWKNTSSLAMFQSRVRSDLIIWRALVKRLEEVEPSALASFDESYRHGWIISETPQSNASLQNEWEKFMLWVHTFSWKPSSPKAISKM